MLNVQICYTFLICDLSGEQNGESENNTFVVKKKENLKKKKYLNNFT